MRLAVGFFAILLGCSPVVCAGILVTRGGQGFEFAEASAVLIGGRDKALSLGPQAAISEPINKLESVKIAGTILREAASGALFLEGAAGPDFLLPQGLPKTAPSDVTAIWSSAAITYKKTDNDKAPTPVKSEAFVAFLPNGLDGLVKLCTDRTTAGVLGGKDKDFNTQIELLSSAIKAYGATPAGAALQKYVEQSMRDRYSGFESGTLGAQALDEGLVLAQLSREAYATDPQQTPLRDALLNRRAWLNRKMAVLRALHVAGEWDAVLTGFGDFERYQASFPDMVEKRKSALLASLESHRDAGKQRLSEGDHRSAVRELKLALKRMPSDSGLTKDYSVAWTEYSRQVAVDGQAKRKQLSLGQVEAINQSLHFADRYRQQKKLDDALKSVLDAEQIYAQSLPVLLKKAEILAARNELSRALAVLDEYDLHAIDQDRGPASKLRNEIMFQLTTSLREARGEAARAWKEQRIYRTKDLALEGLRVKDDDPELLYLAGLSSLAARQNKDGLGYFKRYLDVSNTVDADLSRRTRVFQMLSSLRADDATAADEKGDANWLSGKTLPKGVYYCPISLSFQPKVQRIAASKKLRVDYQWDGSKLRSIVPTFEKAEEATGEKPILFAYDNRVGQVRYISQGDRPQPAVTDPDDVLRTSSVLFPNNPLVDAGMVEKLTGQNLAVTVAGNPYFQPFIWQKLHYFRMRYDDAGRAKAASLLPGTDNVPGAPTEFEFDWDGMKLRSIRGFQVVDANRKAQVYERRMQYQEDRLVTEEISSRGKISKITYKWKGDVLLSAECDRDDTVDDRSREVFFASAGTQGSAR